MIQLTSLAWSALIFQFAAYFIAPFIVWVFLTRKLRVSWRFVGLGSVTWLIALPFIVFVPMAATALLGGNDAMQRQLVWAVALSFAAGIAEETSRYWRYTRNATLRDSSNTRYAIVAGAGHGGTEALVLGLQNSLFPLLMILFVPQMLPSYMNDSNAVASFAFTGGVSRILFIFVHIAFALLIWRAVSQRKPLLYVMSVILHIFIDLVGFVAPLIFPQTDFLVFVIALPMGVWAATIIFREIRAMREDASLKAANL